MSNRNNSPAQFQMTPSMKGKPNSQGTLFRISPDARRPEMRQPRGFSPERRRAVEQSLGAVYGMGDDDRAPGERAALVNTLARSTAPIADIAATRAWHTGASQSLPKGGTGEFRRTRRTIFLGNGREHTSTVLHESAHAVSNAQRTEHSEYGTPERRGAEEAFADNYAAEHSRAPGYKRRPDGPGASFTSRASGWVHREDGPGKSEFTQAYVGKRMEGMRSAGAIRPSYGGWRQGRLPDLG